MWRRNEDAQKYIKKINPARNSSSSNSSSSSSSSKSGGCFITSTVCDSFGKPDDCYELTTFRNFRDNWLSTQPDGKNLIAQYYEIAPKIVAEIDKLPSAQNIYQSILSEYLQPCLKFIEEGENLKCKNIYINMVNNLKEKFLTWFNEYKYSQQAVRQD